MTYSRRLPLFNASGESIRFYLPEALAAKEAAAVDPEAPLQARSEEQRIRRLRRAVERLKRQKGDEADRVKRRGRGVLYLGHLPWGVLRGGAVPVFLPVRQGHAPPPHALTPHRRVQGLRLDRVS